MLYFWELRERERLDGNKRRRWLKRGDQSSENEQHPETKLQAWAVICMVHSGWWHIALRACFNFFFPSGNIDGKMRIIGGVSIRVISMEEGESPMASQYRRSLN